MRGRTLKNIAYYVASTVLSKPLGFFLSFLLAKSLAPANFGVWVTMMLVIAYGPIVCLGTGETLLKMVPYYRGRKDAHGVRQTEESVLGTIIIAALVLVVAGIAWPLAMPAALLGIEPSLIPILFTSIAVSYFSGYFYNRFAAYENFKVAAVLDFARSALALVFVGGMAWIWGLRGAAIGYLLHETGVCAASALLNLKHHGKVGVSFKQGLIANAVRIGFPITLLWWVLTLQNGVDRVVLGAMLDPADLGHYGLGISIVAMLAVVPTVVGRVLYPNVNKHFGEAGDLEAMKRLVLSPTLAMGTLIANVQVLLLVTLPLLYNDLLPKYQPGLAAGQVMALGSFFICLLRNGANFLIAANHERVFLKYILVTLLFNIGVDVTFVKAGWGITGVALGTSLAGFLLNTLVWRRVLVGLEFSRRQLWNKIFEMYLPILVLALAASGLSLLWPQSFQNTDWLAAGNLVFLGVLLNGSLLCCRAYRKEIAGWKNILLLRPTSMEKSAEMAGPAC